MAASVVDRLRPLLAPSLDRRALAIATAALLPAAGRALASAGLRGRQGLPGGRPAALALTALAALAAMLWLGHWLDRRRRLRQRAAQDLEQPRRLVPGAPAERAPSLPSGPPAPELPALVAALLVGGLAFLGVQVMHLVWLADKHSAERYGLLGAPALALLVAGGVLGGLAVVALMCRRRSQLLALAGWVVLVSLVTQRLGPTTSARPLDPQDVPPPARAAGALGADVPHPQRPLNVLLVVLDTLRRDAVSAYGHVAGTTPRLDALAARGTRFADALANGCWTVPSHASLFTGLEVVQHGTGHRQERLRYQPAGRDGPGHPTLAAELEQRGWDTAAFVANMHISASHAFDRGFTRFEEVWRAGQGDHDVLAPALKAWLGWGTFDKGGQVLARGASDWIADRAGAERPWFLFVNLLDAHAPYRPPTPYDRAFLADGEPGAAAAALLDQPLAFVHRAGVAPAVADELWRAYLGGVQYTDALLGRLLDALDASGQRDDTLVIVTSDHGEHFGARGLLGHGQDLDDDLLAIPLVLAGPGVPAGAVDHTPVSLVDVVPSVLAACGLKPLPGLATSTARPALLPGWRVGGTGGDVGGEAYGAAGGAAVGGDAHSGAGHHAERPRLLAKLPLFASDPDEFLAAVAPVTPGGGELTWAVGRRGLVVGDEWLVLADAPRAERRLLRRVGPRRGPADDGWQVVHDPVRADALQQRLESLLGALTPAVPDTLPLPSDDDAAAHLRALGYVGGAAADDAPRAARHSDTTPADTPDTGPDDAGPPR